MQPLFILGNPRSGTSLFRIMLTSHNKICIPPECGFIQWWYHKYKDWSIVDIDSKIRIDEFISDLSTSRKIETWNLNYKSLKLEIKQKKISSYADLCISVIHQLAKQQNKSPIIFGDKNNYYLNHLDLLSSIFPKAKYILIVRDGRDVACSYRNIKNIVTTSQYKPKLPTDIKVIAKEWNANNKQALRFFKTKKINSLHLVLKYEDLLNSTELMLNKVCDFLEIPFDEAMLNYYKLNELKHIEPIELISWKKKTYQKPDINNIGKYKKELSKKEVNEFEEIAYKLLKNLDYEI